MHIDNQRIILIGLGMMGEVHAKAYADHPRAEVVAIVDVHPDSARERATRLGLDIPIFADLDTALREVPAEIVDICLPTDQHAKVAIQALQARKHVFCEKPLALTLAEAAQIREARVQAGTAFQVGHCIRFWPEYQAFEQVVREGELGRLLSLTLQRRAGRPGYSAEDWLNQPERSLGAALDLHIHDTDFVVHLLGTPPAVFSRGVRDGSGWSHIFTSYLYPDVVVTAEGGWNYPATWGFSMAFQAVFEGGAIEYDSGASPTLRIVREKDAPCPLPYGPGSGYSNELAYFLDCVAEGRAPATATLAQSAESLRVVLEEIKSAETGGIVSL